MKVELRRFRLWSVFRLAAVLYGLVGLVVGALVTGATTMELGTPDVHLLERLGAWSLAVFPVLYGMVGGLAAAIAAALYNASAAIAGGVEVEVPQLDSSPEGEAGPGTAGEG